MSLGCWHLYSAIRNNRGQGHIAPLGLCEDSVVSGETRSWGTNNNIRIHTTSGQATTVHCLALTLTRETQLPSEFLSQRSQCATREQPAGLLVYLSNKGNRNKVPALVYIYKGDVEKYSREPCINLIEKCPRSH